MKVISFSLWGNIPKYTQGAIRNAELALKIYPDWECWYYISGHEIISIPSHLEQLAATGNHIKFKWVDRKPDWSMMLDRFQAIEDIDVEVMISRDCDSRLSLREKAAVDEWLSSSKSFHTMHDHPHHSVPILGGMFGIKKGLFSELGRHALEWAYQHEARWQCDQDFLTQIVWPVVKHDTMNHDQFYRHIWGGVPFPSPRNGLEFVGQVFDENEVTVSEHLQALAKAL